MPQRYMPIKIWVGLLFFWQAYITSDRFTPAFTCTAIGRFHNSWTTTCHERADPNTVTHKVEYTKASQEITHDMQQGAGKFCALCLLGSLKFGQISQIVFGLGLGTGRP